MDIKIGTAGWSVPASVADGFPTTGSALERYSGRFAVAEINSSFHRPHRLSTWERWRDSVPDDFRFSVKVPKVITHVRKLAECDDEVAEFLSQVEVLGDKAAALLVQLPPKLELHRPTAAHFFTALAAQTGASLVCEPRNASWFTPEADALLNDLGVSRVAADPPVCAAGSKPGGSPTVDYWRLHGSPVMYRSSYADRIGRIAAEIWNGRGGEVWCIFDNTASSAGAADALLLLDALNAAS